MSNNANRKSFATVDESLGFGGTCSESHQNVRHGAVGVAIKCALCADASHQTLQMGHKS